MNNLARLEALEAKVAHARNCNDPDYYNLERSLRELRAKVDEEMAISLANEDGGGGSLEQIIEEQRKLESTHLQTKSDHEMATRLFAGPQGNHHQQQHRHDKGTHPVFRRGAHHHSAQRSASYSASSSSDALPSRSTSLDSAFAANLALTTPPVTTSEPAKPFFTYTHVVPNRPSDPTPSSTPTPTPTPSSTPTPTPTPTPTSHSSSYASSYASSSAPSSAFPPRPKQTARRGGYSSWSGSRFSHNTESHHQQQSESLGGTKRPLVISDDSDNTDIDSENDVEGWKPNKKFKMDDHKSEAKNKGSSDEDLPLPPSWVPPQGETKPPLPDFRFVTALKNGPSGDDNPHKRLLEALNKQRAESANPEDYIRSMASTMAAYNASLLEPKKHEAVNSFLSRYQAKPYTGRPVIATASTVNSFESYIKQNPLVAAKWQQLNSQIVNVIPDQPSGSSYVKSEYVKSEYNSWGTVDQLSVNEKSAIKGVLDSIENARSQHEEDQPSELTIVLLKHQRQGLSWMVKQEQGVHKGGILADEMGLGKTVQSIAVILKNKPTDPKRKSTLIIAPLAVMQQWHSEIVEKTKKGTFKCLIYHGSQRTKKPKEIAEYDIVITTFAIVGGEMHIDKKKKSGEESGINLRNWGPLFQIDWHRVILDEAHSIKNKSTRSSRATSELKSTYKWCLSGTPIQNSLDDLFSLYRFLKIQPYCDYSFFKANLYRGKQIKQQGFDKLQVLIRGTLLRRKKDSKIDGQPLIVLPERQVSFETHPFSEAESDFYKGVEQQAVIKFNAYLREGTVMQNYSNVLVLLLRLRQACNHPYLIKQAKTLAEGTNIKQVENAPVVSVVGDQVVAKVVKGKEKVVEGSDDEQDPVIALQPEVLERLATAQVDECPICYDSLVDEVDTVATPCGHLFCEACLNDFLSKSNTCPICRTDVNDDDCVPFQRVKQHLATLGMATAQPKEPSLELPPAPEKNTWVSSTKINVLMSKLTEVMNAPEREKVIVFSQFTSMLDIVTEPLTLAGYKFVRFDGQMSLNAREESLSLFRNDPNTRILLMSLKCGSLGLNLTVASRVYLLDIWWNPAIEDQAIDRCHRIGQQRKVQVSRFTIADTVEDRILQLQEQKRSLADGALGEGVFKNMARLTMNDLLFLFKGGEHSTAAS